MIYLCKIIIFDTLMFYVFQACGRWVQTLKVTKLIDKAARYVTAAKSCGYTGLVMLQGMLLGDPDIHWTSTLLELGHPSYYGMMVASFIPDTR